MAYFPPTFRVLDMEEAKALVAAVDRKVRTWVALNNCLVEFEDDPTCCSELADHDDTAMEELAAVYVEFLQQQPIDENSRPLPLRRLPSSWEVKDEGPADG